MVLSLNLSIGEIIQKTIRKLFCLGEKSVFWYKN
jgi:hypothetical protein